MLCSHCGYMMSPFEKDCPRCAGMASSSAASVVPLQPTTQRADAECLACHCTIALDSTFCRYCGAAQTSQTMQAASQASNVVLPNPINNHFPQTPPLFVLSPPDTDCQPPNTTLITILWSLTGMEILLVIAAEKAGFGLALLLDVPAFIIAVILVCSRNTTNKTHGWVKLSLEIVAFLIGFMVLRR